MVYSVQKAKETNATQIAKIHKHCFPDQFMSLLGCSGLEAYYRFFVQAHDGICLVALHDKSALVGFVSGWKTGATYQKPLVQQQGAAFAKALVRSFIVSPVQTYSHIQPRLKLITHFTSEWLKHKVTKFKASNHPITANSAQIRETIKSKPPVNASLLSIAVKPDHRGTGVADLLVSRFVQECSNGDIPEIWLTVHADNARARSFYERNGWQPFRENGGSAHYKLTLTGQLNDE